MPAARTKGRFAAVAAALPFLLGGIQVREPDQEAWIEALAGTGMNTVSVTHYALQGPWDSGEVSWDTAGFGVLEEIRAARARGLAAVVTLRLELAPLTANRFLWHGMVHPLEESELDRWFERYGRFVLIWARLAEAEGVDVLLIGSELSALTATWPVEALPELEAYYLDDLQQIERRMWAPPDPDLEARIQAERAWASRVAFGTGEGADGEGAVERLNARRRSLDARWRALIARVRETYSGRLGYAANFDRYREVGFWDALDVMGLSAYFPLRDGLLPPGDRDALAAALEAGWDGVFTELEAFRAERGLEGQTVIFSELGYTRRRHSTLTPWAETGTTLGVVLEEQQLDLGERALAVRALWEVHRQRGAASWLGGLLWWKLSTDPSHVEYEPFLLILGGDVQDPVVDELRRFGVR